MTDQPDRITWLRAQLDDDAETFDMLDSTALNGIESTAGWDVREYVERGLAEVDAKRQRLTVIELDLADDPTDETALHLLRLDLLPYADRPGYREEWRP